MRAHPRAAETWTAALSEMSRSQLDLRFSDQHSDPFNKLAEMFNNYDEFQYTNACLDGSVAAKKGMQSIWNHCHSINPSAHRRPRRLGNWVRDTYCQLITTMGEIFEKWSRSGNQQAENVYDEWVKFSTALDGGSVVAYARCLFTEQEMEAFRRELQSSMQTDTAGLFTT